MKGHKALGMSLMIIWIILIPIDIIGHSLYQWYLGSFGVTIVEMLYTVRSPLKGADTHFLTDALRFCMPSAVVSFVIIILILCLYTISLKVTMIARLGLFGKDFSVDIMKTVFLAGGFVTFLTTILVSRNILTTLEIPEYLNGRLNETTIYEDYYIKPDTNAITSESPKNLLYIYMESMESTYASVNEGGFQDYNYIPRLTGMAHDNISFSDSEGLGGFYSPFGTGWTMGALFATESGIPFAFPVDGNFDAENREAFAQGTVTLGDILASKGYYQEFLCGSDAEFGGREAFFTQHGSYEIYDLSDAIRDGYIKEDEQVWWGVEDKNLYKIAKDELTRVSALDQPFNFTMLTVDTHHVDGWICDLCEDTYPDQLANVLVCADNQISDFIEWCQEQPWYEDTVIVIQGDHPRMDSSLVDKATSRMVYNCFINTDYDKGRLSLTNRTFNSMDMFPTVLSAMGFTIPGDMLGLGTDMFSGTPTLAERLGEKYFNSEIKKYSSYYIDSFS